MTSYAVRRLLDAYGGEPGAVSARSLARSVDAVVRHGSGADADALLAVFLDDPAGRAELLPVFARHGDQDLAGRLAAATVGPAGLRDGMPAGVLHALGCLGHEPVERLLWEHVDGSAGSWDEAQQACLGLAHLPCTGLRGEIAAALERHRGANFFPEFLPVLAVQTGDPGWLDRLVEWGEGAASTDCNGGLVLGIARYGAAGRGHFTDLLWNPWWEAQGGGTGTDRWAYAGTRVLGIGMAELYADLKARLDADTDAATKRHCLATFTAILRLWVDRPWLGLRSAPDPAETGEELHALLFEWSTPLGDDELVGLAHATLDDHRDRIIDDLYTLRRLLEVRTRFELAAEAPARHADA